MISIAPMIKYTNRHFRYLMRLISKKTLLYTEMISDNAIIHSKHLDNLLYFNEFENPVSLQIGSSDCINAGKSVKIAQKYNYSEYNLNCGCPSERVQFNDFGAILMDNPKKVVDILKSMKDNTSKPITLKHRIGISGFGIDKTKFDDLYRFIDTVSSNIDIDRYTIHARVAILEGLSPDENRTIPPIRYEDVYTIKKSFPHLKIEINGNIKTYQEIENHLKYVDGVMIGRKAKDDPYFFSKIDSLFFDSNQIPLSKEDIVYKYADYLKNENSQKRILINPLLQLFSGEKNSKLFKNFLSKPIQKPLDEFVLEAYDYYNGSLNIC